VSNLLSLCQHIQLPATTQAWSQAQRLFHGRGQAYAGLSHVTVDWLPPVILITLFKPEPEEQITKLAQALLINIPACTSIQLQQRHIFSSPIEVIHGQPIEQLILQENNLRFHARLGKTQNTGLFLDMRNGRQWVQENSQNKRVLNLFAYTCAFSVAAIAGNAKSVFNIDLSRTALSIGRENHRLNHQALTAVQFEKLDIFKSFGRIKKRGPYDLLICDPPSFQKGSVDIVRDYPKILRRLDEFMAPDATLLLCLNAPEIPREYLMEQMTALAPDYALATDIKPPAVFVDAKNNGLKTLIYSQ
jgi:23S rRNA (cytosine1962-C5)-methyltransferase